MSASSATSAFWAPIEAKVQQQHADQQELAKQQRSSYQGIIQDPETSDEVKNWAWGEWQKSLHPEARKNFGKIQPLVTQIMGALGKKPTQPTPAAPIPAPQGPVFDTAAANQRALDQLQKKSDIEQKRQIEVAKARPQTGSLGKATEYRNASDPSAPPITVQQHNRTGQYYDLQGNQAQVPEGYTPYKAPTTGTRRQFRYTVKGPDGKPQEVTVFQDSKTQQMFDIHGKPYELPEGAEPVDEEAKLAKIRGSYYGTGAMNSLKREFKAKYPDISDDEAERMASEVSLERAQRELEQKGAAKTTERPIVVNGEVQAVPFVSQPVPRPFAMPTPAPGGGPVPAPAPKNTKGMLEPGNIDLDNRPAVRNADGSTSTVRTITAEFDGKTYLLPTIINGKLVSNDEAKQHFRQTGQHMGAFSSEDAAEDYDKKLHTEKGWDGAPGSAQAAWQASANKGAGPKPAPGTQRAPAPGAPAGGRVIGLPPAQYRTMLTDIRAVRAGAGQLFGDPNAPNVKGLADYSDIADNKGSRERLGKALRLTFDGLDQATSGGGAGVHGDGGKLDVGGIGTWVGNQLGIPGAVADQQAKMFQQAMATLTPREREAYDATIASAEGIIGLRRITGASPSLQSVRAIQEAMPVIGVNTIDGKQFGDKLSRLAVEFSAGTRGIPRAAFDEETRTQLDEINQLPARLSKRGAAPAAAPQTPTVNTQKEFDALPKGSVYIDKQDGKRYKKP